MRSTLFWLSCIAGLSAHAKKFPAYCIGSSEVYLEVVMTPEAKARGLMERTELPLGYGMLFTFSPPEKASFWMKRTLIPLSLGYFDAEGRFLEHHEMNPEPGVPDEQLRRYESSGPVAYAVEMRKNWFSEARMQKGRTRIRIRGSKPCSQTHPKSGSNKSR